MHLVTIEYDIDMGDGTTNHDDDAVVLVTKEEFVAVCLGA